MSANNHATKVCAKCGGDKESGEFYNHRRSPDGRQSMCKACQNEYMKTYRVTKYRRVSSKVCSKCGVEKRITEFSRYNRAKDGRHSACKSCRRWSGPRPLPDGYRQVSSKVCSKCGVEKRITEFYKNKRSKDGHFSACKQCELNPVFERRRVRAKECTQCGREKEISEFNRSKRSRDGRLSMCKACQGEYHTKYRVKYNQGEYHTKYRVKYNRALCSSAASYRGLSHLEPRWTEEGHVSVPCYKCGEYFTPTNSAVRSYLQSFKGNQSGECNLYCSDTCKYSCPVFGRSPVASIVPVEDAKKARSCQTNHLKLIQCDEDGHNHCEKCGDIIDVQLHHTLPVAEYGLDSISSASHILLCWRCHQEVVC